MTTKDFKKVFKQLESKPAKLKKFLKHNSPKKRSIGIASRKCRKCGRHRGHIRSYGIEMCRQCFREDAKSLGFKKFE